MPDDQPPRLIVFTIDESLRYWCRLLNCEKGELLNAIRCVGNSFDTVESYLNLNRRLKTIRDNMIPDYLNNQKH